MKSNLLFNDKVYQTKNIEKKNSNYEAVKLYNIDKNNSETRSLEDCEINTFEKLENYIETNLYSIEIDKEFTCKIFC